MQIVRSLALYARSSCTLRGMLFEQDTNPLTDADPARWERLIASLEPASLLVVIGSRMSDRLAARATPEDVLQDSLLVAWRDRARCEWRGLRAFRAWLLTIIDHQIRNLAEHDGALKRGGAVAVGTLSPASQSAGTSPNEPRDWTTPSRALAARDRARAMRRALRSLEPDLAAIVRLRVHEEWTIEQIAAHVTLDEAAVRRRLRKGALQYERALAQALEAPSSDPSAPSAASSLNPAS